MAAGELPFDEEDGPWIGMIDALSPPSRKKGYYQLGINIYPADTALGSGLIGRPGTTPLGSTNPPFGACQGYYDFIKRNGTQYTIMVAGGEVWVLDWSTFSWNQGLLAADLTGAAITLHATARVQMITYTDKVVFNDGSGNIPFAWDGTAHGGMTKMTNAPPFAPGGMADVAYNGRLLAIKYADPTTFVWSETDTLNTGYEAGGFNNAWTFVQTDQHRLFKLIADNDGIYVLRGRAISEVTGVVTQNWSSFGTRDGVSDEFGTESPFAAFLHGNGIFFVDADVQMQFFPIGATKPRPVWDGFRQTLARAARSNGLNQLSSISALYYQPAQLILVLMPSTTPGLLNGTMSDLWVFDARGETPVPVAIWTGGFDKTTAIGILTPPLTGSVNSPAVNGRPMLVVGDATGQTRMLLDPAGVQGGVDTGSSSFPGCVFRSQALGDDVAREKIFDRLDLTTSNPYSAMSLNISTDNLAGGVTVAVPQGVDSGTTGGLDAEEQHTAVGIDLQRRYIKVSVRTAGIQFGLNKIAVSGAYVNNDPAVP